MGGNCSPICGEGGGGGADWTELELKNPNNSASSYIFFLGGIGGFVLAVFHKLEITKKLKHIRECGGCCNSCLVREGKVGSLNQVDKVSVSFQMTSMTYRGGLVIRVQILGMK